jgi:FkbM family methyltransferase
LRGYPDKPDTVQTMPRLTDTDRERLRHLSKLGLALDHFFDIGASNGRWASRVSRDFPKASFNLFEPLIDHSAEYRQKMEMIFRSHPDFRLHKVALGAECKKTSMFLYPADPFGSTALPLEHTPENARRIEVDMLTIDYAMEEFQLPVPQVIKMDTQGCELNILKGATKTLPKVDLLLLECWLTRAYGSTTPLLLEVSEWLRQNDFHLWDLGNPWRDETGVLVTQDCLFLNARSKVSRMRQELAQVTPVRSSRRSSQELLLQRMKSLLPWRD